MNFFIFISLLIIPLALSKPHENPKDHSLAKRQAFTPENTNGKSEINFHIFPWSNKVGIKYFVNGQLYAKQKTDLVGNYFLRAAELANEGIEPKDGDAFEIHYAIPVIKKYKVEEVDELTKKKIDVIKEKNDGIEVRVLHFENYAQMKELGIATRDADNVVGRIVQIDAIPLYRKWPESALKALGF